MKNREIIIEKFKVLLASLFPVEETVEVVEEAKPVEVTMAEATLEDGTVITYEMLEVDQPINVVNADGTLAPLADGDYTIEDKTVTVVGGMITAVVEPIETETPEPVVIVEPVVMEEEAPVEEPTEEDIEKLINDKVEEVKLAYEAKLTAQKAEFDAQVEALGNKFKETPIIQAPVEVEKKPLTYKDRIAVELAEKRKELRY